MSSRISWTDSTSRALGRYQDFTSAALRGCCLTPRVQHDWAVNGARTGREAFQFSSFLDFWESWTCPRQFAHSGRCWFAVWFSWPVCVLQAGHSTWAVLGFLMISHWDAWTVSFYNKLICSQTYLSQKILLILTLIWFSLIYSHFWAWRVFYFLREICVSVQL